MNAKVKATAQMRDGESEQSCPDLDNLQYRCRLCGEPLSNGRALFHSPCLKEDKRRRIAAQRRVEREKFERWLEHTEIQCLRCGEVFTPKVRLDSGTRPRMGRAANTGTCEASTSIG